MQVPQIFFRAGRTVFYIGSDLHYGFDTEFEGMAEHFDLRHEWFITNRSAARKNQKPLHKRDRNQPYLYRRLLAM